MNTTPHQFEIALPQAHAVDAHEAKRRHHLAFLAFNAAKLSGDAEHAEAARRRFMEASAVLADRRKRGAR